MIKIPILLLALALLATLGLVIHGLLDAGEPLDIKKEVIAVETEEAPGSSDQRVRRRGEALTKDFAEIDTTAKKVEGGQSLADPDAGEGDLVHFVVVDDRNEDETLAGVVIRLAPASEFRAAKARNPLAAKKNPLRLITGRAYRVDQNGTLAWRRTELGAIFAVVDTDDWIGGGEFPHTRGKSKEDPVTIRCLPQASFDVIVVDSQGRPAANVEITLEAEKVASSSSPMAVNLGRTAEDGRARVAFTSHHEQFFKRADSPLRLQAVVIGVEGEGVSFDPQKISSEPYRLQLPPAGTLVVRVFGPGGEPLLPESGVNARPAHDGARVYNPFVENLHGSFDPRTQAAQIFPVGLNAELGLIVKPGPAERFDRLSSSARGPTVNGEKVEVELRAKSFRPLLTGRLLHPNGDPAREITFGLSHLVKSGIRNTSYSMGNLQTDAEGRFAFAMKTQKEADDQEALRQLVFRLYPENITTSPRAIHRHEVPRVFPPGETDLGDVQLAIPPLLVSARLMTPEGVGLSSFRSEIQSRPRGAGEALWTGVASRESWRSWIDEEGRFEIRGFVDISKTPQEYQLKVSGRDFLADPVPITLGQSNLTIQSVATASLRGKVKYLEDRAADHLGLQLRFRFTMQASSGEDESTHQTGSIEKDGSFAIKTIRPGNYILELRSHLVGVIYTSELITLGSGEDRDLGRINFSSPIRRYQLTFESADGSLNEDGIQVRVHKRDGNGWRGATRSKDNCVFYSVHDKIAVTVRATGHRAVKREILHGRTHFRLHASPEVRVRLTSSRLTLPSKVTLSVELYDEKGSATYKPLRVEGDVFFFRVGGAGSYEIRPAIKLMMHGNHTHQLSLMGGTTEGQKIEITDASGQEFQAVLDEEDMKRVQETAERFGLR